jgi:hypothetical protein
MNMSSFPPQGNNYNIIFPEKTEVFPAPKSGKLKTRKGRASSKTREGLVIIKTSLN